MRLAVLVALLFAPPALASDTTTTDVPGWNFVIDVDHEQCLAYPADAGGATRLNVFALAARETYRFTLLNPAWKSLKDGDIRVAATFLDRNGKITDRWDLSAFSNKAGETEPLIGFDILHAKNDSANFIEQFKRADSVWFWNGLVPIADFKLAGSSRALDKLDRCRTLLRLSPDFDPFRDK